jgi:hypothetical protein
MPNSPRAERRTSRRVTEWSRKCLRLAVLTAAVAAVPVGFGHSMAFAADPAPATRPATDQAQVPIRQVVLFSSGVGYFEHFGSVQGNGTTELSFKTQQINDVLKSLVLQDLDKGKVDVITYPSQDPVSRTLRSFQVDLTNNPALHDLLEQLRGAKVTVTLGGEKVDGTVLGVEKKQRPAGDKDAKGQPVVDVWYVNLLVGVGIRPVPLDDVRTVDIDDPKLRDELQKALAALAQARDQDKKPVTIGFRGQGEHRVRIGYVVETPIWKTSYRLIVEGEPVGGRGGEGEKGRGGDKDTAKGEGEGKAGAGGAAPAGGTGAKLQGWAIVENQTDNDWNDVQLSLVSGRPISFIQDLYQPLYVPRPTVRPELYASLVPQTYEGGLAQQVPAERFAKDAAEARRSGLAARAGAPPAPSAAPMGGFGANAAVGGGAVARSELAKEAAQLGDIDASASVASAASAAKLGELFQYTVGSVSLPRQKSAMIPIITDPIEVEKLSIYNQTVLAKHPLYGARIKNTTGKNLLQGPITVLQGGSYAGDARIEDLPPGQERLISYGIDLQVAVQGENQRQESSLLTGKIVKGVLQLSYRDQFSQEYVAESKADHDKTLIIEHPRRGGGWKLTEPAKADETTDALYRFKGKLEPSKPKKLTVREEQVRGEAIAILPMDVNATLVYAKSGPIPKDVRDALTKAAGLKGDLVDTQRQLQERQQRIAQISQEQQRLRENMKTVDSKTEYYNRLLKKLDEQETQIEGLQKEVDSLTKQQEQQRKALEDYLGNLSVG